MLTSALAAGPPSSGGDEPWVVITLAAIGGVVTIVTAVWANRKKGEDPAPPQPPATVTAPLSLSPSAVIPPTADGQLELAKMLVQEVNADRAALRQELEQEKAERRAERDEMTRELRETREDLEQLKTRLSELAGINAQLRYVLQANGFPLPPGL